MSAGCAPHDRLDPHQIDTLTPSTWAKLCQIGGFDGAGETAITQVFRDLNIGLNERPAWSKLKSISFEMG